MRDSTLAARSEVVGIDAAVAAYWILRVGAALCFIGHGAFGFITKAAWVPYFGLLGIPESWAYALMPWVGAVDVTVGMAVLFAPRPAALAYMTVWAVWTALLRPLTGESLFETLERAGNYGVPLALLLYAGWPRNARAWFEPVTSSSQSRLDLVRGVLHVSTVLLVAGHGALGAIVGKTSLAVHYAAVGIPASAVQIIGWAELALAALIAARPATTLLVAAAVWKLASESLFLAAGDPVWEFVERAGSYAAPLALALLISIQRRPS